MLPEPCRFRTRSGLGVFAKENVKQIPRFQFRGLVRDPLGIHQQRKRYPRFLAKDLRISQVAKPDSRKSSPCPPKLLLVLAQLRDMLAAENSTIMAQEHQHPRPLFPQ